MPELSFSWLGTPSATVDGRPAKFRTRKAEALLVYLTTEAAVHASAPVRREALLGLLWPDYPARSARQNLRTNLSYLKKGLAGPGSGDGEELILSDNLNVWLNVEVPYRMDVELFGRLLARSARHAHEVGGSCPDCLPQLEEAAALYQGDFLTGFFLPDSPEFEQWILARREELRRQALQALETIARAHLAGGRFETAQAYARRQLEIEPLSESAYRQQMEALARMGRRRAALSRYEALHKLFRHELDVEPSAETKALLALIEGEELGTTTASAAHDGREALAVSERERTSAPSAAAPVEPPRPIPHNLPAQPTSLVGREKELAALGGLIANPDVRLITIVGPGGMGKTRLALQAAQAQLQVVSKSPFVPADGVYFVPLASLTDSGQVAASLASAIELSSFGGRSLREQLLARLRDRTVLLLLDNFEHLLPDVSLLQELLTAAPGVKLLVTSRERLNLGAEWVFEMDGLGFPPEGDQATGPDTALASYSALRLFGQRAHQASASFVLDEQNIQDIIRIARLVEGLPLGLEIAAAWVTVMTPQEIALEIGRNLDFLAAELRDLPERHRSLRAVFNHSWSLLTVDERSVFSRLSIFRGGFTREAAEKVAGASLHLLAGLVGKSLVRREGSSRYDLHELLRQYTEEELRLTGKMDEVRNAHLDYFLVVADQIGPRIEGPEFSASCALLQLDYHNLLSALDWAGRDSERHGSELRLAGMLGGFWQYGCNLAEGRARLEAALSRSEGSVMRRETRAKGLYEAGRLAYVIGDLRTSRERLRQSVAIYRRQGASHGQALAHALTMLGLAETGSGNYASAIRLLEEGIELLRALGEPEGLARGLWRLGWSLSRRGDYERASHAFHEARVIYERKGNHESLSMVLHGIGEMAVRQGDVEVALETLNRSLEHFRQINDQLSIAAVLGTLAALAMKRDQLGEALKLLTESLTVRWRLGDIGGIAWCLERTAEMSIVEARSLAGSQRTIALQRAARLYGAASAMRAASGSVIDLVDKSSYEAHLEELRQLLDETIVAAAWAEGEAMRIDQAVALAAEPAAADTGAPQAPPERSGEIGESE